MKNERARKIAQKGLGAHHILAWGGSHDFEVLEVDRSRQILIQNLQV